MEGLDSRTQYIRKQFMCSHSIYVDLLIEELSGDDVSSQSCSAGSGISSRERLIPRLNAAYLRSCCVAQPNNSSIKPCLDPGNERKIAGSIRSLSTHVCVACCFAHPPFCEFVAL